VEVEVDVRQPLSSPLDARTVVVEDDDDARMRRRKSENIGEEVAMVTFRGYNTTRTTGLAAAGRCPGSI
jgi:hypothetical protein